MTDDTKTNISSSEASSGKLTFAQRVAATKTTRRVRFAIVALLWIALTVWVGNWWMLLVLPLLFDIYITGYIPFTWWKNSKNPVVRVVMSWVDAIVYAVILVYFVFTFIGQNYQIPSSSLEKSLLVGDYLVVNKMAYGPRVPMTPLHFPLVQNTLPILNTKSYIEWPQWTYHRLKGLGNVERNDIVVFNFPAGDTVALKVQNPDYYTLTRLYGHNRVNSDPETFGSVIWRPVDRRENYVKRAVGLPGETLSIVDGVIHINSKAQPLPKDAQYNYWVQVARPLTDDEFETLGISPDDRIVYSLIEENREILSSYGFQLPDMPSATGSTVYLLPLTTAMHDALAQSGNVIKMMKIPAATGDFIYPIEKNAEWTRSDYGPIWIPRKGATIDLNPETWALYGRCIRNYEYNDAHLGSDGRVYIDGKPADTYTFKMDYYFMMGDNRDNSLDSRYWGFVPEDHIVGRPEFVLVSFDKDKGLLDGGIRWNRVFSRANHDK